MRTIRINESGAIITGKTNAYRSYKAALKASQVATTTPGVVAYYNPKDGRDYYLGLGDTLLSSDGRRSTSQWGKGGLVNVVEVAS